MFVSGGKIDINAKDSDGNTALMTAVTAVKFNIQIVKTLLEKGANLNMELPGGGTVLHEAAYKGNAELCELLLKHGAKVNAQDSQDGATPLHVAVEGEHAEVTALLMRSGADTKIKDVEGNMVNMKVVNQLVAKAAADEVKQPTSVEKVEDASYHIEKGVLHDEGQTTLQAHSSDGH